MAFFFWPLVLLRDSIIAYSVTHFLVVAANKIKQIIDYFIAKNNCEKQSKAWVYLSDWADYFCTWCGDWDFIYQGDVFNSTTCWNELLALARTPQQIIAGITRFAGLNITGNMDFSQQNWSNWTLAEWQNVLDVIQAENNHLEIFNLSQVNLNPYLTNPNNYLALTNFLSRISVRQLLLVNQGLGENLTNQILQAMDNSLLTSLDLSGNNISDQGIITIAPLIPRTVQSLKIANNQITDYGLDVFCENLTSNHSLTLLDVSINSLSDLTPQILANFIPNSLLQEIILSANDFSSATMDSLWQVFTSPDQRVNTLIIADANLSDMQLATLSSYLPEMTIEQFDFSDNYLSDQTVASFMLAARNASVFRVDFSGNIFTDDSIQAIADNLPNTSIANLGLARASYSLANMPQMLQAVVGSNVTEMNLSGNLLGDSLGVMLSHIISQPGCGLSVIDVSANGLSDIGAQAITAVLPNSPIRTLLLANNEIQCLITPNTTSLGFSVEVLDLSTNPIDDDCLINIASLLSVSALSEINLFQTSISDRSASVLATSLVSQIAQPNDLTEQNINLDMRRNLFRLIPATNMTQINAGENNFSDSGIRAFCRVLKGAGISMDRAILGPNPGEDNAVNWRNCQASSAASKMPRTYHRSPFNPTVQSRYLHSQPQISANNNGARPLMLGMLTGVVPIVLAIILLYLLYRALAPSVSRLISKTSNLFGKAKQVFNRVTENKAANDHQIVTQYKSPANCL